MTSAKVKDSEYGLVEWVETLKNPRDGTATLTYLPTLTKLTVPLGRTDLFVHKIDVLH